MYMLCVEYMVFKKKCDLVSYPLSYLVTYSLTDKEIHGGAPLLKTIDQYFIFVLFLFFYFK